jgi:Tfp pilus assembly protein PilF
MVNEPQDTELRYEAGMLFFAEGAGKEGAAWLHTVLKIDPGHRKAHAALADYYERIGEAAAASHHRSIAEGAGTREGKGSELGSS